MSKPAFAVGLLLLTSPTCARTYLLSIDAIRLATDERVETFSLETWGVTFKSVCHVPDDWEITVRGAGIGGLLSGEAGHGVVYLSRTDLPKLKDLALVELSGGIQRARQGTVPPTFHGSAFIQVGYEDQSRTVPLTYRNVRLLPATRCPFAL